MSTMRSYSSSPARSWRSAAHRVSLSVVAIGLLACSDRPSPVAPTVTVPAVATPMLAAATGTYNELAAGRGFTCGVRSDGVMNCWGDNTLGQAPSTVVPYASSFTRVDAMQDVACGLRADGAFECWGRDYQTGFPSFGHDVFSPPAGHKFTQVTAGAAHACGLLDDGVIYCFGDNSESQAFPTKTASAGHYFIEVSAGAYFTCGLQEDGVIACNGLNVYGEAPYDFRASTGSFVHLITSGARACGLRLDGLIECAASVTNPIGDAAHPYADAAYGSFHVCYLRQSGVVECNGDNDEGQAPAIRTASLGAFVQVVAGSDHSCALRTDHRIECWGDRFSSANDHILPTATLVAPASVIVGQPFTISLTNAQVPGFPNVTAFEYSFTCTGWGFTTPSTTNTSSCTISTLGTKAVGGRVIDPEGDMRELYATVIVKSPQEATTDLKTEVSRTTLAPDIRRSLVAKLDAAITAIAANNTGTACSSLQDFSRQVQAQRGKAIPLTIANGWLQTTTQLRSAVGC